MEGKSHIKLVTGTVIWPTVREKGRSNSFTANSRPIYWKAPTAVGHVGVAMRLGYTLCMPHSCSHCGSNLNNLGTHGLSCHQSSCHHFQCTSIDDLKNSCLLLRFLLTYSLQVRLCHSDWKKIIWRICRDELVKKHGDKVGMGVFKNNHVQHSQVTHTYIHTTSWGHAWTFFDIKKWSSI